MKFSAVKDLFKKFDILPKRVIVLVVTEKEIFVDLAGLSKSTKYVVRFRAKELFLCVFIKSEFQRSQGLVQKI